MLRTRWSLTAATATACLAWSVLAHAQDPSEPPPVAPTIVPRPAPARADVESGGFGFLAGGVRWLSLSSLNDRLRAAGFRDFANNFFSVGGGGQVVHHRFVLSGEGHALLPFQGSLTTPDYKQRISGGFGLFRFGFVIFDVGVFRLYPLVGIGLGSTTLSMSRRGDTTFSGVLANPAREVSMTSNGLLLDAGLGVDSRVHIGHGPRRTSFFVFGLRAGYTWVPYSTDWSMLGASAKSGPDMPLNGPYGMIVVGLGGSAYNP